MSGVSTAPTAGELIRDWRRRRRTSQLDLALDAGVSARHVSFIETGRSRPSAAMVLKLTERLEVPLRDRNQLLLAAGYAPVYGEHDLDDPAMGPVRESLGRILTAHEPYPAVAVDRHWGRVATNRAVGLLLAGVAEHLLAEPVNVLRLSLHPDGLAPRILNLAEWRAHLLERLGRQAVASGDPALSALHEELAAYQGGEGEPPPATQAVEIAVPLRLRTADDTLELISTVTTFGTATEVTLSELAIETFLPADAPTEAALRSYVEAL